MTMAAVIETRTGTQARPETSRIAGVELLSDMREAESAWRSLEQSSQFSTPYQRFDFLRNPARSASARHPARIVIAYDGTASRCCCCLGVKRERRARARFSTQAATFNMALWRKLSILLY